MKLLDNKSQSIIEISALTTTGETEKLSIALIKASEVSTALQTL
ncbi:hypothetical protein [Halarcobacter ebronensis]|nr:hypothetical protein [Halarcobacter ebronensis]